MANPIRIGDLVRHRASGHRVRVVATADVRWLCLVTLDGREFHTIFRDDELELVPEQLLDPPRRPVEPIAPPLSASLSSLPIPPAAPQVD